MIIYKTYRIKEWICWGDEIFHSTLSFFAEFGLIPNILTANDLTYFTLDLAAQAYPENLFHEAGQRPEPDQLVEIGSFVTDFCSLDFCRDNNQQYGYYSLVFDTHAELIESHIPQ